MSDQRRAKRPGSVPEIRHSRFVPCLVQVSGPEPVVLGVGIGLYDGRFRAYCDPCGFSVPADSRGEAWTFGLNHERNTCAALGRFRATVCCEPVGQAVPA